MKNKSQKTVDINKTIGKNIRYMREKMGLDQIGLAKMLHISNSSISSYENGDCSIKVDRLTEICSCLDVNISDIICTDMNQNDYRYINTAIYKYTGIYYLYYFDATYEKNSDVIYCGKMNLTQSQTHDSLYASFISHANTKYDGHFQLFAQNYSIDLSNAYESLCIYGFPPPVLKNDYIGGIAFCLHSCSGRESRPVFKKVLLSSTEISDREAIRDFLLLPENSQYHRISKTQDDKVYHFIKTDIKSELPAKPEA